MKKSFRSIFIPIVAVFFLCVNASGILGLPVGTPQNEAAIATIRSRYATINSSLRRYRKVRKDLSGESTEGGSLMAYLDGNFVRKIVATYYGETGRAVEEYYYWNEQLIFVFRKDFRYTKPLSGKVRSSSENRFYFDRGRLIRWLDENRRAVPTDNSGYREQQEELLKDSQRFTDTARS